MQVGHNRRTVDTYNFRYNHGPSMHTLKLTQVGNSIGVILPKEALARLRLEKGDTLYLTDTPNGYRITVTDPAFEEQMEAARKIMKEYRGALAELAK